MFALTAPLTFRHDLIVKKVICSQQKVNAVVDTGAGISVISPGLRDLLQLETYRCNSQFSFIDRWTQSLSRGMR